MTNVFDKRKARRLQLKKPAPGSFATMPVYITDVSETGAGIEHSQLVTWGQIANLEFWWKKDKIRVTCDVVRTDVKKDSSDPERTRKSGLRFCNPRDPNLQLLRKLVGQALTLVLQAEQGTTA
jgi:hypothetical protein